MKNRGKLLSLIIIWNFIGFIPILLKYLRNPLIFNEFYPSLGWYSYYYIFSGVLYIGINIGLWFMKKMAVYLLIMYSLIGLSIQLFIQFILKINSYSNIALMGWIIISIIWYITLSRKWKYFKN